MGKKHKKRLSILDLAFISILDRRPTDGQFILLSWDIGGWCGYESTYWDKEDTHCQHAVAWFPLPENHVYTRKCALVLSKARPVFKWSTHFSIFSNGKYISKEKIAKVAYESSYTHKENNSSNR